MPFYRIWPSSKNVFSIYHFCIFYINACITFQPTNQQQQLEHRKQSLVKKKIVKVFQVFFFQFFELSTVLFFTNTHK